MPQTVERSPRRRFGNYLSRAQEESSSTSDSPVEYVPVRFFFFFFFFFFSVCF